MDLQLADQLMEQGAKLIPLRYRNTFAPATLYIYEWQSYWLELPGVEQLSVGGQHLKPLAGDVFEVRFENQLGLSTLRSYVEGYPLSPTINVEVISRKFPTLEEHRRFYRTLLDDLFTRAARLPFHFTGLTARGVRESLRPPTPLFTYHYLLQYAPRLHQALTTIRSRPHRLLTDHPAYIPLVQANEIDADVLLDILHNPQHWTPARGFPLAQRLRGYAPTQIWQHLPIETLNTPENRFVLAFLHQLLVAAGDLTAQSWWSKVSSMRQRAIIETTGLLRQCATLPLFDQVGELTHFPHTSQVLLRRDGYRELQELYWLFHQARRPLFAPMQHSIEVRDVATLYEQWVFFVLVEEISIALEMTPEVKIKTTVEHGLHWKAVAQFGNAGELVYNQRRHGYSIWLRPDFTWVQNGRPEVVLDAKFRLNHRDLESTDQEDSPLATIKHADLYKMHTYRDALGVQAAVAVYPGDVTLFYDRTTKQRRDELHLYDLLNGDISGVGAIALKPGSP